MNTKRRVVFFFRKLKWSNDSRKDGCQLYGAWPNSADNKFVVDGFETLPHVEKVLNWTEEFDAKAQRPCLVVLFKTVEKVEGQVIRVSKDFVAPVEGEESELKHSFKK